MKTTHTILIVDDDIDILEALKIYRKFQDISQSFFDFLEKYLFFYERNLVLLHFRVICIACRYILSI